MDSYQSTFEQLNQTRQIASQLLHETQQGSMQYRAIINQEKQNVQMLNQVIQNEKQAIIGLEQALQKQELAAKRCQDIINYCNQLQHQLTNTIDHNKNDSTYRHEQSPYPFQ
ncbi:hypothetical protein [Bacillus kwashiorkori]|uniref:hypothetical protein n=1 Tax=Bacillus kwashiorkori TaxID=1522318 RepID=UPI0007813095|nr:hypothetical protein [Bacillus kwashiorkori]